MSNQVKMEIEKLARMSHGFLESRKKESPQKSTKGTKIIVDAKAQRCEVY